MIKINKIAWDEQLDIAGLAHGTVVIDVSLDHPMFENQRIRALNICLDDFHWKKVKEMIFTGGNYYPFIIASNATR